MCRLRLNNATTTKKNTKKISLLGLLTIVSCAHVQPSPSSLAQFAHLAKVKQLSLAAARDNSTHTQAATARNRQQATGNRRHCMQFASQIHNLTTCATTQSTTRITTTTTRLKYQLYGNNDVNLQQRTLKKKATLFWSVNGFYCQADCRTAKWHFYCKQ